MSDNNSKNLTGTGQERTRKPRIPKLDAEGFEASTQQQYASFEQSPGLDQSLVAESLLAADQLILQQVIANPRTLTPKTTPSVQRTVGNRTGQWLIARAVARQQTAKQQRNPRPGLEQELDLLISRGFRQDDQVLAEQWDAIEDNPQAEGIETETEHSANNGYPIKSHVVANTRNVSTGSLEYGNDSLVNDHRADRELAQIRKASRYKPRLNPEDEDELEQESSQHEQV